MSERLQQILGLVGVTTGMLLVFLYPLMFPDLQAAPITGRVVWYSGFLIASLGLYLTGWVVAFFVSIAILTVGGYLAYHTGPESLYDTSLEWTWIWAILCAVFSIYNPILKIEPTYDYDDDPIE